MTDLERARLMARVEEIVNAAADRVFDEQCGEMLERVDHVVARAELVAELRRAKGKGIGADARAALEDLHAGLSRLRDMLVDAR